MEDNALVLRAINTIRFLSVDAVQKAKSGALLHRPARTRSACGPTPRVNSSSRAKTCCATDGVL